MFLSYFLAGCSGHEHSEKERYKAKNAKIGNITRKKNEHKYPIIIGEKNEPPQYPWEDRRVGGFPRITKEFFVCKGSFLHSYQNDYDYAGSQIKIADCGGSSKHSLPIKNKKEFIYPILIDLLNFVQKKAAKKVVITCGHRCPVHNQYAAPYENNRTSKHLIGAEVDFYVEGLEREPERVVLLLQQYYREHDQRPEFIAFRRDESCKGQLKTLPWFNKEIYIKLFAKNEGRDFDNKHPYPYISIQVRYDRHTQKNVQYTWAQAYKGYLQW